MASTSAHTFVLESVANGWLVSDGTINAPVYVFQTLDAVLEFIKQSVS